MEKRNGQYPYDTSLPIFLRLHMVHESCHGLCNTQYILRNCLFQLNEDPV